MVEVTYVDRAGFIKSEQGDSGAAVADSLASVADDIRSIRNVYGSASQQQAFWRRVCDLGNVEGGN